MYRGPQILYAFLTLGIAVLSTGIVPVFIQAHCSLLYHRLLYYSLEDLGVKEGIIMKLALKKLDVNVKMRFNCQ